MFEEPKEIKESSLNRLFIGIVVIVLLAAVGAYFYVQSRSSANKQASAAAKAQLKDADAVRDLKIQRATMDKDRNGAMTVWAVSIENKSNSFSYSKIRYETTYVGADNRVLMVNQGTINDSVGPGEQSTLQANDPLYPPGTATYRFKITGATAAIP
jgi:cell division protein FtsI/penicillin-binding protein 2